MDDDGTQDWAANYKGEGGEWVAKNNGIRQKADKPAGQRVRKNKEIKFMQKDFFQQYGVSGWIFCFRKNSQCARFAQSVLYEREEVVGSLLVCDKESSVLVRWKQVMPNSITNNFVGSYKLPLGQAHVYWLSGSL